MNDLLFKNSLEISEPHFNCPFCYIRLSTEKQYQELFNTAMEHIFFHEYIHYIQSITSSIFIAYSDAYFNMIKALYHSMKKEKVVRIPIDINVDDISEYNINLFGKYYFGDTSNKKIVSNIRKVNHSEKEIRGNNSLDLYEILFCNDEKYDFNGRYIAEGICFFFRKHMLSSRIGY